MTFMCRTSICAAVWAVLTFASPSPAGEQVGTAFTYQGQLKQGGVAYNGSADLQFTAFGSTTGSQAGLPVEIANIDVVNGLFSVAVALDEGVLEEGSALELEVAIRVPHDPANLAPYTTLSPRQAVTATPFATHALTARNVTNLNLPLNLATDPADDSSPALTIQFTNPNVEGTAVLAISDGTGSTATGVQGIADGDTGIVTGVRGTALDSPDGVGILGEAFSTAGPTRGVWGRIFSADGHAGYFDGRGFFSGRLGVGIENPAAELDVAGTTQTDGLRIPTGAAAGRILECADAAGNAQWVDPPPPPAVPDGHSLDAADGSPVDSLVVDNAGNVGIGTAVPTARLHVAGTPGVDGIRFPDDTLQITALAFGGNGAATTAARSDHVHSFLGAPDGDPNPWLILDNNGNVGIGTVAPSGNLHVRPQSIGATPLANSTLVLERSGSNYLSILSSAIGERGVIFGKPSNGAISGIVCDGAGTPDGLQFRTGGTQTRVVIDSTGRVGIGTTAPAHKLHITGTAGSDGIQFPDSTVQTTAYRRLKVSAVFNPPSVAAGGSTVISISVPGAVVGDVAVFNPRTGLPANLIVGQTRVNTDAVAVTLVNVSAVAIDAGSNTADVVVFK